jgi:zinc protease
MTTMGNLSDLGSGDAAQAFFRGEMETGWARRGRQAGRWATWLCALACGLLLGGEARAAAQAAARVVEATLDNGLRVLLVPDRKVPLATVQVWYRVGSRNEGRGLTGLSHFLEHMMFKGTARVGPKEFSRLIQRDGGQDNAFTGYDYTGYYATVPAGRVGQVLELEADRMTNLRLDPREVAAERQVVLEERRSRTEDDPEAALTEELHAAAYRAHPYGQPIIGWETDVERLTVDDLRAHYRTHYVPNNAILVVVGDFEPEPLLAAVRATLGRVPAGPAPPPVRAVEPPQRGERRILVRRPAELPYVMAGYHVPNFRHRDGYALELLDWILSGGKSARLTRGLKYERQVALSVGSSYGRVQADPTLFYVYAGALPGVPIEEVERALEAEIARIQREGVSERELAKARNQAEADFLMSQESTFTLGRVLAQYEVVGGWRLWEAYLPGIRAVTREDIQRVARAYLVQDNRTVAILVPAKAP